MNTIKTFAAIAVVALGTAGTAAQAQFLRADSDFIVPPSTTARADAGTPLTRNQVVAEREQARRDGTLVTDFVTGKPVFAVDVSAAQRDVATTGKSRADVRAEVAPRPARGHAGDRLRDRQTLLRGVAARRGPPGRRRVRPSAAGGRDRRAARPPRRTIDTTGHRPAALLTRVRRPRSFRRV